MAIQTAQSMDAIRRRFNPERDMVWALPRLIKRALSRMTFEPDKLRADLQACSTAGEVFVDDDTLTEQFKQAIGEFAGYIKLSNDKTAIEQAKTSFARLFDDNREFATLLSVAVMKEIFLELPVWFEQVKPQSELDPQPDVEEIDAAVERLLASIRSRD